MAPLRTLATIQVPFSEWERRAELTVDGGKNFFYTYNKSLRARQDFIDCSLRKKICFIFLSQRGKYGQAKSFRPARTGTDGGCGFEIPDPTNRRRLWAGGHESRNVAENHG
jgi:hypothetical protein